MVKTQVDGQHSYNHGKLPVDSKWSWVGLCACFMGNFLAEGLIIKCFGVYFVNLQEKYDTSAADTAWVISIAICLMMSSGIIGNALFNWIGPRRTIFLSSCLACVGCVFSSIAPNVQTLYFTFSVIMGVSCGMIFAVSTTAAGVYFDKYRGIAVGITMAGSGLGSFAFAPLVRYFTSEYGVNGNFLLLGGFVLQLGVFSLLHPSREIHAIRQRVQQKRLRRKACEEGKTQAANKTCAKRQRNSNFRKHRKMSNHNETIADIRTSEDIVSIDKKSVRTSCVNCADGLRAVYVEEMQQNIQNEAPSNLKADDYVLKDKQQKITKCDASTTCTQIPTVPPLCPNDAQLKKQVSSNNNNKNNNADNMHKYVNDDYDVHKRKNKKSCADLPCKVTFEQDSNKTHPHEQESGIYVSDDSTNVLSLLKNPLLLLYACTAPLMLVPYISIFVMLPPHAKQLGYSEASAAFIISIIGITEVVARIVAGFFIDRHFISNHVLYKLSGLITAAVFFLIPSLRSYTVLAVSVPIMAVGAALFSILMPVILCEGLGEKQFPIGFGIAVFAITPAALSFPVIEGKLRDVTGSWNASFYLMGSVVMAATISSLLHPWVVQKQLSKNSQDDKKTEQEIFTITRC